MQIRRLSGLQACQGEPPLDAIGSFDAAAGPVHVTGSYTMTAS
jgi:hypothetical protein